MAIKPLPSHIIAQISAGEVIERPASVVKELVENSLDAGAGMIKIEIEKAGLKRISVLDDGHGMNSREIAECFKQHTTSKIAEEDDLHRISSFGFRGEALFSIAAISRVAIRSKTATEAVGTELRIEQMEVKDITPIGMPTGTQVIVESLFENTPARKNFVASATTELASIVQLVSRVAMAFPKVGFTLIHNERTILHLPKDQTQSQRIRFLLGASLASNLIPVSYSSPHGSIEGYIGTPQVGAGSRSKQFIFVNKRYVRDISISLAAKTSYGSLLDPRLHPVLILFLTLPPETIDINIHPRKEEVRFLNGADIQNSVKAAISDLLGKTDLTFRPTYDAGGFAYYHSDNIDAAMLSDAAGFQWENDRTTARILRDKTDIWTVKEKSDEQEIMQIHDTYLLHESPRGLMLVDQHAAHERILYQQFLETFGKNKEERETHTFTTPILFDITLSEAAYLHNYLDIFHNLGFDIETFGNGTFKVTAVPSIFRQRDIPGLITEVLDALIREKGEFSIDRYTQRTISYLACRSAIKAGDYLAPEERKKLLEKLEETDGSYTCPHGRPVKIEISRYELERLFRRK